PFGGMNMIFAGDFAQLPPVGAERALYAQSISMKTNQRSSMRQQEAAIGKALWYQVTTVVILRQNMRQCLQTPNDAAFHTALENMRYKSCTPDDIQLLKSLVASSSKESPKTGDPKFRHVSIITARNIQRDKVNEMGSTRFANDVETELTDFYSYDTFAPPKIHPSLQQALWSLPHSMTEHHAGKLSLCKGLPVMVKFNKATECCVTNGAEATVYDWDDEVLPTGQKALKTLFVKLKNPPKNIQLPGLPLNVVLISRQKKTMLHSLPDDSMVAIARYQVPVLSNFAMTDYCSQGRTRSANPVDLRYCCDHRAYYTALSRGSTYDGTVIVRDFDESKLRGGLSGYLQQ
ncbi:hypothetical protein JAAARDRAFT_97100, partial [Jaapia argillacea MUCL 33604]